MRKISADFIFPVSSPPIKNGVVVVDDEGKILDVTSPLISPLPPGEGKGERYKGIIVPGFVNTHCHLELSHLKGRVSEHKGLTGFISELVLNRDKFSQEQIKSAIVSAEDEMIRNGIVAVGDISNSDHSFEQKKKKRLVYHTFIEAFDLSADKAQSTFNTAVSLNTQYSIHNSSITPHSTYTVSGKLMELIDNLKQPILSIHNQESESENELFAAGTGPLAELMNKAGVDIESKRRARSSLLFTFGSLLESRKILLVHNTYTSKEDIELIKFYMQGSVPDGSSGCYEMALCLCPQANLYIENRLPDIPMFIEMGMKLTIGTDSYASNRSLSVLEEIKTISKHFPQLSFETLITWSTKNGAEFLGMEKELGTIEKGKKPGLNLIKGIDIEKMKLNEKVEVKKLV